MSSLCMSRLKRLLDVKKSPFQRILTANGFTAARDVEFDVFVINSAGRFLRQKIDLKSLKDECPGLHARDVVSLGILLDTKKKKISSRKVRKSFTNVLKLRESCLLAAMGHIRMILKPTELILFDPHLPIVKSWVGALSRELQTNTQHFGLFVLEDLLRDTCDSFDRRLALYNILFKSIQRESRESIDSNESILNHSLFYNLMFEEKIVFNRTGESHIYKLAPLQDLLYEFELELKDVQTCIGDVLNSVTDIEKLNVTGSQITSIRNRSNQSDELENDSAEFIFETYALRLSTSMSGILQLQQKIKSQHALADMTLKMKRNRILWLNVNLSAASLAIAFCGGGFAIFGMNLPSGFEVWSSSFYAISTISIGMSGWIYYRLLKYMRGDFSKTVEENQLTERKFLESIFVDIDAVDVVLNSAMQLVSDTPDPDNQQEAHMTKKEFAQLLADVKGVKEVDPNELDVMFGLLDVNTDGVLDKSELDIANGIETPDEKEHNKVQKALSTDIGC